MTGYTSAVGTISIRKISGGAKVRMIKVRADGPISGRWKDYARWWWLRNRGPVPAGKRVCHLDGDTLNDDPSNLGLLTPGDVIFLALERDPAMERRMRRNSGKATAQFNHDRAMRWRATNWLSTKWYPVDFAQRLIHNQPRRMRWQVYADNGLDCDNSNWRRVLPKAMGWPGFSLLQACILTVLAERGPLIAALLGKAVRELRAVHRWPQSPVQRTSLFGAMSQLRGLIVSQRRGRCRHYAIAQDAISKRSPIVNIHPIRGNELSHPDFLHFKRAGAGECQEEAA